MMELEKLNLFNKVEEHNLYEVRNKDKTLALFNLVDEDIAELIEDISLPFFISNSFMGWLESRVPPKHRENIENLLKHLGLNNLKSIIDFSKGLSLTDTLWVVPKGQQVKWENVSLFVNRFDETIAKIAFDGGLYGIPISTTSPELGTNGMLAKCWIRNKRDGKIYLVKTGTEGYHNSGNEPYSENLASQVLSKLGYRHIPYEVRKFRKRLVSTCPIFTSEERMLLPIHKMYDFSDIYKLIDLCKRDGIVYGLAQHLIFDYLSLNNDRHSGNLGVLLNADTYELIDFAPIYDNGVSMLNYWDGEEDINCYIYSIRPVLYSSFELGAKLAKRILGNNHNVHKLIGFKFDRSSVPNYSDKRIIAIERFLQERVNSFLNM